MKRIPHPIPNPPKRNRSGVVPYEPAIEFLQWTVKALAALCEQAPIIELHASEWLRGAASVPAGSGGRSFADDGTLPGPTPGQALKTDREARMLALYESGFKDLREAVLKIAYAGDFFMVMDHDKAQRLVAEESGGKDCKECGRFVAQQGNDWLRSGLCMTCYQAQRRAKVDEAVEA